MQGRRKQRGCPSGAGRALTLVTALVVLPLVPAAAGATPRAATGTTTSTATVPLSQATYFWAEQKGDVGGSGVAAPTLPDSTITHVGDLAVSATPTDAAGHPDKETFIEFGGQAFDAAPLAKASVSSFLVTLPLGAAGEQMGGDPAAIALVACRPTGGWAGSDTGADNDGGRPQVDCAKPIPLRYVAAAKAFTVDLAGLATSWAADSVGNNRGVAIRGAATQRPPFQVAFDRSKITTLATYTPASAAVDGGQSSGTSPSGTSPGSASSGSGSSGTTTDGSTSGLGSGSTTSSGTASGGTVSGLGGTGTGTGSGSAPAPVVAGPATPAPAAGQPSTGSGTGTARSLTRSAAASSLPSAGGWLLAVVGLLVLLLVSLVIGDTDVRLAGRTTERGLGRRLRTGQLPALTVRRPPAPSPTRP